MSHYETRIKVNYGKVKEKAIILMQLYSSLQRLHGHKEVALQFRRMVSIGLKKTFLTRLMSVKTTTGIMYRQTSNCFTGNATRQASTRYIAKNMKVYLLYK